jgi:hypothetical protein
MTKRPKYLDNHQTDLNFDQPIEKYAQLREELINDPPPPIEAKEYQWEEYNIEIAVAAKKAIRESGLSREQIVDAVNKFFGWPLEGEGSGRDKRLTIHMLNNHLCKPAEYPMTVALIHAICRITSSLEPLVAMVAAEGCQVLTRDEAKLLALGKIDNALAELQRIKKTFRVRTGSGKGCPDAGHAATG